MSIKLVTAQRDFSAGEIRPDLKRSELEDIYAAGLRTCTNFRILDTKKLANRQGRRALFIDGPRNDQIEIAPGVFYYLCFRPGTLVIRDANGTVVASQGGFPWSTLQQIQAVVWDESSQYQIFIAAASMRPWVLTWDKDTSVWSMAPYQEQVNQSGQKRTFFYRLSPKSVTMAPSAATGNITVTFSSPIAVPQMVGTYMRFAGRQILITAYVSPTVLDATVIEALPGSQGVEGGSGTTPATNVPEAFSIGDEVIGSTSGAHGIVVGMDASGLNVQLLQVAAGSGLVTQLGGGIVGTTAFQVGEQVVGPGGSLNVIGTTVIGPPFPISVWDDELMNDWRGWPRSLAIDQSRLCFCDFPALPSAVGYSAIGNFFDLYIPTINLTADAAILELAPNQSRLLYMCPGAEYAEFLFADNAIYYIPVTVEQPLSATAGLSFNRISRDGCGTVQPRMIHETLVYVSSGGTTVRVIAATGSYQRPFEVRPLSMDHDHMLNFPTCIAAPSATNTVYPERYLYVVNSDGTACIVKANVQDGQIQGVVGWTRITGRGSIAWISACLGQVTISADYPVSGSPYIAEVVDGAQLLDCVVFVNNPPSALAPPAGDGSLWWMQGQQVYVMDGLRPLGLYSIDGTGRLIPRGIPGENLASPNLVAGFGWTSVAEIFMPGGQTGQDVGQRTTRRRRARINANFQKSTGFVFQKLYAGKLRPGGPALGQVMNSWRIPGYIPGDDVTQPPPQREGVERWRPMGREFDPRTQLVKDDPGSLEILEITAECTV